MFDIYHVILWAAAAGAIVYWWRISGQKQHALNYSRRYCADRGLQLLDQTLVFRRYHLSRDARHRHRVLRQYQFDFSSDGENRYQGEISLYGLRVVRIVLETEIIEIADF
ncbi:MAG: DUF3301 domain-containing protein [Pseudohongiellaceae bacterium]